MLVGEDAVTTITLDRGAVRLLRFPVDGGEPAELLGAGSCTTTPRPAGWSRPWSATPSRPARSWWSGTGRRTRPTSGRLRPHAASLRPMEELEATAPDGAGSTAGW